MGAAVGSANGGESGQNGDREDDGKNQQLSKSRQQLTEAALECVQLLVQVQQKSARERGYWACGEGVKKMYFVC